MAHSMAKWERARGALPCPLRGEEDGHLINLLTGETVGYRFAGNIAQVELWRTLD